MKLNFTKVIYGFVIMALYLIIGIFVLVKNLFGHEQSNTGMVIFGVVVIIYGLYRGYRSYKSGQTQNDEKDEVE